MFCVGKYYMRHVALASFFLLSVCSYSLSLSVSFFCLFVCGFPAPHLIACHMQIVGQKANGAGLSMICFQHAILNYIYVVIIIIIVIQCTPLVSFMSFVMPLSLSFCRLKLPLVSGVPFFTLWLLLFYTFQLETTRYNCACLLYLHVCFPSYSYSSLSLLAHAPPLSLSLSFLVCLFLPQLIHNEEAIQKILTYLLPL